MTRFSVNLKNILGLSFYRYNISADTYNPTIDTNVTVTCKVTNILGTPISNKTVTLLMDNAHIIITENNTTTDISEQTTDANGEATWTIPITDWELHNLTIATNTIYIQAKGWRYVANTTPTSNFRFLRNRTQAQMILVGWSRDTAITTSFSTFGTGTYASTIKPKENATGYLAANIQVNIDSTGTVKIRSATGSNISANTPLNGQFEWIIGE